MAVCPTHPGKYYMPFKCAFDGLLNQTKNGPLDYCSVMNCQTPDNLLDLSSFLFSFLFSPTFFIRFFRRLWMERRKEYPGEFLNFNRMKLIGRQFNCIIV